MFNLDKAITEWRRQIAAGGLKTPVVLDELENHLREDVERQVQCGTNAQQAFETAVRKIGRTSALKREFQKLGRSNALAQRLMIAIYLVSLGFIIFLSTFAMFFCYSGAGERIIGLTAVAFILLTACSWRYVVPFLPVISNVHKRALAESACLISGILFATFFCQIILPRLVENRPDGQLPAAGFWIIMPVAIGFALGAGLREAASRRNVAARS